MNITTDWQYAEFWKNLKYEESEHVLATKFYWVNAILMNGSNISLWMSPWGCCTTLFPGEFEI